MRIVFLIPGTCEAFYCENCLRDLDLAEALEGLGHTVRLVPLYLPLTAEGGTPGEGPIFFGGISVYLTERSEWLRRAPLWLRRALDSRRLLRWAARAVGLTSPQDLGESTLSMLRGEHGHQARELERLAGYLAEQEGADAVVLSNGLLVGLVRRLKEVLRAPVAVLLQDEDSFLDALPEAYSRPAWEAVAARAADVDLFIAGSDHFRGVMIGRLGVAPDRVRVVRPGINPATYEEASGRPDPPVVGFLSPALHEKGLDLLVEAVLALREEPGLEGLRLRVTGGETAGSRPFLRGLKARLRRSGHEDAVEFLPNLGRADRQAFLRGLSVLSVPARRPEACGLWVLEALASGVPVVAPRHGGPVELIEATGGGVLIEPGSRAALCDGLRHLLLAPDEARRLGRQGRRAVLERFTADAAAQGLGAVLLNMRRENHGSSGGSA
jgi:glycosyltransferase involved in cell wall biosynthesis